VLAGAFAVAILRLAMRVEAGPEYDTNANRAEVYTNPPAVPPGDSPPPGPIASFLLRATASGQLAWAAGPSLLRLQLNVGGKLFFADAARPQDAGVVQAGASEAVRIGKRFALGLGGDYYDAYQWIDCPTLISGGVPQPDTACHRDFRTGSGRLEANLGGSLFDAQLAAGGRFFTWKPDDALSFDGVWGTAQAGAHLRSGNSDDGDEAEWDLTLAGRVEWRRYHGPELFSNDDPGSPLSPSRDDTDVLGTAQLSYLGPLLAQAAYTIDYDRSNSFGQTYLRHLVTLKVAFELGWKIVATTKVQLVFITYKDPVALTSGMIVPLSIEDENRDALVVDLERPIGRGFSLSARYSRFSNGVSTSVLAYERQVVYLGLAWRGAK
jgi:hypothetical protein